MSDIFISYAREDKPKAQQLAKALERQGWSVWWDIVIPAGMKFGDVILEKLNTADAIVVLWSQTSVKSDWVLDEAQLAKKRNVLIPVFIERVSPPLGYGQIHAADLVGWDGSTDASGFVRLVEDIKDFVGEFLSSPVTSNDFDLNLTNYPEAKIFCDSYKYIDVFNLMLSLAHNGDPVAQFNIGTMYDIGCGVEIDQTEALKWYQKAADQGNLTAQCNLGYMYERGSGVVQNDFEAVKWYRKAAKQGNTRAQSNLGTMYLNGRGVLQNDVEAAKWYRKAARQGDWDAEFNLGYMYSAGRGVVRSYSEAVKWYRKAARHGDMDARYFLERKGLSW